MTRLITQQSVKTENVSGMHTIQKITTKRNARKKKQADKRQYKNN